MGGNPAAEFLALPPGLEQIDRLLDDPVFFEPFVPFFDPLIGRPSIPIETYLRMMVLRFRYRLGFETLCAEVTDSLAWRRFCRIGLTDAVPHPSTLTWASTGLTDIHHQGHSPRKDVQNGDHGEAEAASAALVHSGVQS